VEREGDWSVDVHCCCGIALGQGILRREAVLEDRLDEYVLVVEEQHVGGRECVLPLSKICVGHASVEQDL
jgi:hypothetical protein